MNSNRTSRARLVTAAASVVIAALSLTACNDGSGVKDEGASSGSAAGSAATLSPSAPASPSAGGAKNAKDAQGSQGTQEGQGGDAKPAADAPGAPPRATKAPGAAKAPGASRKFVTCEGSVTKTVAAPLTRPINHMLLTVTNTGSNPCYLYGYPAVRFGEAQSVPPVDESTQPQAVVTLEPGESGYASVRLSGGNDGSGSNGYTAKSLAVYFQGRSGNESVGSGAKPALPQKGIYVDDTLEVTYWQQSMDSVLSW